MGSNESELESRALLDIVMGTLLRAIPDEISVASVFRVTLTLTPCKFFPWTRHQVITPKSYEPIVGKIIFESRLQNFIISIVLSVERSAIVWEKLASD